MLRTYLILATLALCLPAFGADVGEAFETANSIYTAAENAEGAEAQKLFHEAAKAYEAILPEAQSWTLHHNLGNALFRLNDFGGAVLHYRKALALNPNAASSRGNLLEARKQAGLPQPAEDWHVRGATHLPMTFWIWLTVGGAWIALFLLILPPLFRGYSPTTLTLALLGVLTATAGAVGMYGWHRDAQLLVVTQADAPLRAAPAGEATPRRNLPPALYVSTLRTHEEWAFVRTEQGDTGWILRDSVAPVWE